MAGSLFVDFCCFHCSFSIMLGHTLMKRMFCKNRFEGWLFYCNTFIVVVFFNID